MLVFDCWSGSDEPDQQLRSFATSLLPGLRLPLLVVLCSHGWEAFRFPLIVSRCPLFRVCGVNSLVWNEGIFAQV